VASILDMALSRPASYFVHYWKFNTSQAALYSMEYLKSQHRRNVRAVLNVDILWRISSQCGHHTAGLCGSDFRHLVIQNSTLFGKTSGTE